MSIEGIDIERLDELREALDKLVKNPELFKEAAEAFEERDYERFQSVLSRLGIIKYCLWICRWYCVKVRAYACTTICPSTAEPIKPTIDEMLNFGKAVLKIIADKEAFKALLDAYSRQDADRFQSILKKWDMMRYCRQFCNWFAYFECFRACELFCPKMPVITHVGQIPTNQVDPDGYANGPSEPDPNKTKVPDVSFPAARGDHPFSESAEICGILNIANPDKYKVEHSPDKTTWTPIMTCIKEWNGLTTITRCPSGLPDAGWYNVSEMVNVNYLTVWQTPSGTTGKYYLRLTVKNAIGVEFVSDIVAVRVDNEYPQIELQNLMILKDGTEKDIKCGGIKKGEGKIVIRFKATDPNFRLLTLVAEGGCGLTRDIVDETTSKVVNRSYEGNKADTGEPTWRTVIWDPWKDPLIEETPCCYLIVLRVFDRAIINNNFYGGHESRDHEAVQIALP